MAASLVKGSTGALGIQWTEGAIILAISTSGSDTATVARPNRLTAGDYSSSPFATPQAAYDALPKGLNHDVLLRQGAGTFTGFLAHGFIGAGRIRHAGSSTVATLTTGTATGTAGSGTSNTTMNKPVAAANWTVSDLRGKFLIITSGGGSSGDADFPTIRPIQSNTTTSLQVDAVFGMDNTSIFQIANVTTILTAAPGTVQSISARMGWVWCQADVVATRLKAVEDAGWYGFIGWNSQSIDLEGCDLRASSGYAGGTVSCQQVYVNNCLLDGAYTIFGCQVAQVANAVIQASGQIDALYVTRLTANADALACTGTAVRVRDTVSVALGLTANSCTATPLDAQNCHHFQIDGVLTGTNAGTTRYAVFSRGGQYAVTGADGSGSDYYEFEIEGRPAKWSELAGINSGTYASRGTFIHWGTGYTVWQTKLRVSNGVSGDAFDEFVTNGMVIGGTVKHYGPWQSLDPAYKEITAHAGGGQGSATVIGYRDTVVPTAATDGDSVRLLSTGEVAYAGGMIGTLWNTSTKVISVFPPSGSHIWLHGVDQGLNTAITLQPGQMITWLARNNLDYNVSKNAYSSIGGVFYGVGANPGITSTGGATGHGGVFAGGSTSGSGLVATATDGHGITAAGGNGGNGGRFTGNGNGSGIVVYGGATGDGGTFTAGTNCNGVTATAAGTGAGLSGIGVATGIGVKALNAAGIAMQIDGDATSPIQAAVRWTPQDAVATGASVIGDAYMDAFGYLRSCHVAGTPGVFVDATTITSLGTIQSDAAALSAAARLYWVNSGAASTGVRLPSNPAVGDTYFIFGTTGNSFVNVWPASGDKFNLLATDARAILWPYCMGRFTCIAFSSTATWEFSASPMSDDGSRVVYSMTAVFNGPGGIITSTGLQMSTAAVIDFNSSTNLNRITFPDNLAVGFWLGEGTNHYLDFVSTNAAEVVNFKVPAVATAGRTITVGPEIVTLSAHVGNASLAAADSGLIHTNSGAVGTVVLTLPAGVAGTIWHFHVATNARTLTIQAPASTTIRVGDAVSTAAGSISTNLIGAHLTLIALSATVYEAISLTGTWNDPV